MILNLITGFFSFLLSTVTILFLFLMRLPSDKIFGECRPHHSTYRQFTRSLVSEGEKMRIVKKERAIRMQCEVIFVSLAGTKRGVIGSRFLKTPSDDRLCKEIV